MASSSEHQGLQIAVIIFALLTIIMSGATFYVFKLSEDAELRAAEATRKDGESQAALRAAVEDMGKLRAMMGTKYRDMGADPKMADVETVFKADMLAYANTLLPENQAYANALEDSRVAQMKGAQDLANEIDKVNKLTLAMAEKTKEKEETIESHRAQTAAALAEATGAKEKHAEDRTKLNEERTQLAQQVQIGIQQITELQAKNIADAKKATDSIDALTDLKEGIQKQLDDLRTGTFVTADGEIRWVSPQAKTVWINVGRDDGLKKNVTFSVYGLDQNGVARSAPKASIEVTQVLGAHLAEARILEDSISDPILIRDQLYTPLWHPGRTEQFAICGLIDVDKDGVSDVSFVKDLIRRNGGEWVAELLPDGTIATQGAGMTINTRYMIKGAELPGVEDEYGKMVADAKQLGVETLPLEKFLDSVGWKETQKVVNFGRNAKPEDFMYDPNQDKARRPTSNSAGANNFRRRTPPRAGGSSTYDAPR